MVVQSAGNRSAIGSSQSASVPIFRYLRVVDDEALAQLANLDADRLHYLYRSGQLNQTVTAFGLKELATLENSNA